jgi:hypothetical protein
LRLPDFPSDVIKALENGEINLFRITAKRLALTPVQAERTPLSFNRRITVRHSRKNYLALF